MTTHAIVELAGDLDATMARLDPPPTGSVIRNTVYSLFLACGHGPALYPLRALACMQIKSSFR